MSLETQIFGISGKFYPKKCVSYLIHPTLYYVKNQNDRLTTVDFWFILSVTKSSNPLTALVVRPCWTAFGWSTALGGGGLPLVASPISQRVFYGSLIFHSHGDYVYGWMIFRMPGPGDKRRLRNQPDSQFRTKSADVVSRNLPRGALQIIDQRYRPKLESPWTIPDSPVG